MGVTNFPNKISDAGTVSERGLTSITGAGTITTGLDTIVGVIPSLAAVPGTATDKVFVVAGTAHVNATGASTFIVKTYQVSGSAGTVAADVAWHAFGTKA